MKELSPEIINFFQGQGVVIVSTLDSEGRIHSSAKGIVSIEKEGKVYIIDLYRRHTFENLKYNSIITITAVDEHQFMGYALKGRAGIAEREDLEDHIIKKWKERIVKRISKRLIKNIKEERKPSPHPEASFPAPQYLIVMDVEQVVNLAPDNLK